ncbi:hypothetical protein M0R45_000480 [Rubus argutus]|uniref:B box-type domain-containing protein n=1 Tax=Rubus argutus TaxID=59490 RepID=A0AAW1VP74_RUBAR
MRTLCDVCESAAAILFCAADEAALCRSCDEKVHMCNKLANRHVRVGISEPSDVSCCDICENAPAFFYCERVQFPGDNPGHLTEPGLQQVVQNGVRRDQNQSPNFQTNENQQNHNNSPIPVLVNNIDGDGMIDAKLIDLNTRPQRIHGQSSTNQDQGLDVLGGTNNESASVVPVGNFKR